MNLGEKLFDRNGKQLFRNIVNDTKGEELYDKNKKIFLWYI